MRTHGYLVTTPVVSPVQLIGDVPPTTSVTTVVSMLTSAAP